MNKQPQTSAKNKKINWITYGLILGAILYAFKFIVNPLFFNKNINVVQAIVGIPFYAISGLGIGYLIERLNKSNKS